MKAKVTSSAKLSDSREIIGFRTKALKEQISKDNVQANPQKISTLSKVISEKEIVPFLRSNHNNPLVEDIKRHKHSSWLEVMKAFNVEKACKNQAYYFILENGLLDLFAQYSKIHPMST